MHESLQDGLDPRTISAPVVVRFDQLEALNLNRMWNVGARELYSRFVLINMRMLLVMRMSVSMAHIHRVILLMMRVWMGMGCFSFVVVSVRVSQDPPHVMVVSLLYLANFTFVTHNLGAIFTETAVGGIDANQGFPGLFDPNICHMRMNSQIACFENFYIRKFGLNLIDSAINPLDQDTSE